MPFGKITKRQIRRSAQPQKVTIVKKKKYSRKAKLPTQIVPYKRKTYRLHYSDTFRIAPSVSL